LNPQTIVFNQVWIASPISILKTVVLNQSSDFISHFNPQTNVFESSSDCSSPFQFLQIALDQARIASPISILKAIVLNQAQMSFVISILITLVLNQAQISSLTSILKTNGLNQSKTILGQQDARMYTSSRVIEGGWSGIRGYCSKGFWPLEGFTSFSAISPLGLEEVRRWKLAFRG